MSLFVLGVLVSLVVEEGVVAVSAVRAHAAWEAVHGRGEAVRERARATLALCDEVERLRSLCRDGAVELERRGYMTAGELCARDALAYRLRAAGGDP